MNILSNASLHIELLEILLYSLLLSIPNIFYISTLQKALSKCKVESRTISPNLLWLNLIPIFNLVWNFVIVNKMASSLENEFKSKQISTKPHPGKNLGLAMCILVVCSIIFTPIGDILFLAAIIYWIGYWVKIANFSKLLGTEQVSKSSATKYVKWVAIILFSSFTIWFLVGAITHGYELFYGRLKYIDCTPKELLTDLENRFKIEFPEGMQDVQTAKNKATDSNTINYVVKFTIAPNIFEKFLTSFPEKIKFEEFTKEDSGADSHRNWGLVPGWFKTPITKGKMGVYNLSDGEMFVFIDTSNQNNLIVYLNGWYIPVN